MILYIYVSCKHVHANKACVALNTYYTQSTWSQSDQLLYIYAQREFVTLIFLLAHDVGELMGMN
jgi:hypothetical protein